MVVLSRGNKWLAPGRSVNFGEWKQSKLYSFFSFRNFSSTRQLDKIG